MKKKILIVIILIIAIYAGRLFGKSDVVVKRNMSTLTFDKDLHDFAEIPQGKEVLVYFKYKVDDNKPVTFEDVESRCGCTVAKWNMKAIPSGTIDSLPVYFDAEEKGYFSKEIIIHYNSKNGPQKLFVTGTVK